MRILKYYWNKVSYWFDDHRWLKAIGVVAACLLIEMIFVYIARNCSPDVILWYAPILFPLALIIHMFLSSRGFDINDESNDGWAGLCVLMDFPILLLLCYVGSVLQKPILHKPIVIDTPLVTWIYIIVACIIAAACISVVVHNIKFGLFITLLQIIRTLLNPFIFMVYLIVMLLGTDTRPNNEQTLAENKAEIRKHIIENSGKDAWEKEEKAPGFLDMLDDLAQGGEKTGENVAYGSQLYDVRQSVSGEKFIVTEDGKKHYNDFTGKYEDD